MTIKELKKELEKFDDSAEVFFDSSSNQLYPKATIDWRFFTDDYNGFNLVLVEEKES